MFVIVWFVGRRALLLRGGLGAIAVGMVMGTEMVVVTGVEMRVGATVMLSAMVRGLKEEISEGS